MALFKPVNENLLYMSMHAYNRIIQQAHQNSLQTYPDGIFDYGGEEKLRILYHKKSTDQSHPNIFESK